MVCVNSTSATLALAPARPVCTIGEAIYNMPGLTIRGHLDDFWADPSRRSLVSIGASGACSSTAAWFAAALPSESAVATLVRDGANRLSARIGDSERREPGTHRREMIVPGRRAETR